MTTDSVHSENCIKTSFTEVDGKFHCSICGDLNPAQTSELNAIQGTKKKRRNYHRNSPSHQHKKMEAKPMTKNSFKFCMGKYSCGLCGPLCEDENQRLVALGVDSNKTKQAHLKGPEHRNHMLPRKVRCDKLHGTEAANAAAKRQQDWKNNPRYQEKLKRPNESGMSMATRTTAATNMDDPAADDQGQLLEFVDDDQSYSLGFVLEPQREQNRPALALAQKEQNKLVRALQAQNRARKEAELAIRRSAKADSKVVRLRRVAAQGKYYFEAIQKIEKPVVHQVCWMANIQYTIKPRDARYFVKGIKRWSNDKGIKTLKEPKSTFDPRIHIDRTLAEFFSEVLENLDVDGDIDTEEDLGYTVQGVKSFPMTGIHHVLVKSYTIMVRDNDLGWQTLGNMPTSNGRYDRGQKQFLRPRVLYLSVPLLYLWMRCLCMARPLKKEDAITVALAQTYIEGALNKHFTFYWYAFQIHSYAGWSKVDCMPPMRRDYDASVSGLKPSNSEKSNGTRLLDFYSLRCFDSLLKKFTQLPSGAKGTDWVPSKEDAELAKYDHRIWNISNNSIVTNLITLPQTLDIKKGPVPARQKVTRLADLKKRLDDEQEDLQNFACQVTNERKRQRQIYRAEENMQIQPYQQVISTQVHAEKTSNTQANVEDGHLFFAKVNKAPQGWNLGGKLHGQDTKAAKNALRREKNKYILGGVFGQVNKRQMKALGKVKRQVVCEKQKDDKPVEEQLTYEQALGRIKNNPQPQNENEKQADMSKEIINN